MLAFCLDVIVTYCAVVIGCPQINRSSVCCIEQSRIYNTCIYCFCQIECNCTSSEYYFVHGYLALLFDSKHLGMRRGPPRSYMAGYMASIKLIFTCRNLQVHVRVHQYEQGNVCYGCQMILFTHMYSVLLHTHTHTHTHEQSFGEDKEIYIYFFIALVVYNFFLCLYAVSPFCPFYFLPSFFSFSSHPSLSLSYVCVFIITCVCVCDYSKSKILSRLFKYSTLGQREGKERDSKLGEYKDEIEYISCQECIQM